MTSTAHDQLCAYLLEAHALQQNILRLLDCLASTCSAGDSQAWLNRFKDHTELHLEQLRRRLGALGKGTCLAAEIPATAPGWLKGLGQALRAEGSPSHASDLPCSGSSGACLYEPLARLAERMGDGATAGLAREARDDEEELARWLESRWEALLQTAHGGSGYAHPA